MLPQPTQLTRGQNPQRPWSICAFANVSHFTVFQIARQLFCAPRLPMLNVKSRMLRVDRANETQLDLGPGWSKVEQGLFLGDVIPSPNRCVLGLAGAPVLER